MRGEDIKREMFWEERVFRGEDIERKGYREEIWRNKDVERRKQLIHCIKNDFNKFYQYYICLLYSLSNIAT